MKSLRTVTHIPDQGMELFGHFVPWGIPRNHVRAVLMGSYEEQNSVTSLKQFGFDADDIISRKDVYRDYRQTGTDFTMIYSENDLFQEFELHAGKGLRVEMAEVVMGENYQETLSRFNEQGIEHVLLDQEEILFPSLKTVIASSNHLGGEGPGVAYIYCAQDITHLLKG